MANGIDLTMQLLAKSPNQAATRLLETALRSSDAGVSKVAGKHLIGRRGHKGALELIRNFDLDDKTIVELILENREKIQPALRSAMASDDKTLAQSALLVITSQRFYEALPFLLTRFSEKGDDENDSFLSAGILRLLAGYVNALEARKDRGRLYGTVLPGMVASLLSGLKSFHRNDPDVLPLALLSIYPYLTEEHKELTQYLRNTTSQAYLALFRVLLESSALAVPRFVFFCMNHPSPPAMVPTVFAKRQDPAFLSTFFNMLAEPMVATVAPTVSSEMRANLSKLPRLEWLDNPRPLIEQLDESSQLGLVMLIQNLGLIADETQAKLIAVVQHGRSQGRVAALAALERFSGERLDQLIWEWAGDTDPLLQVEALKQLAKREMPNGNSRILQFVDSPHEMVRRTIQTLLPFRFANFMHTFDQMSDQQRRGMFNLVRKLDTNVVDELAKLLVIGSPMEKAKALLCVGYGDLAPPLEDALCGILTDEKTPALRAKAAELLATGRRALSRSTLVQALHRDPASEVRDAAKKSLETRPTN